MRNMYILCQCHLAEEVRQVTGRKVEKLPTCEMCVRYSKAFWRCTKNRDCVEESPEVAWSKPCKVWWMC